MVMGHIKFNDGQSVINRTNLNKTGLATYCNVTLRRIRATIVTGEKL